MNDEELLRVMTVTATAMITFAFTQCNDVYAYPTLIQDIEIFVKRQYRYLED